MDYTKYPKAKSSGTSDDDFIKIYRLQSPEDTLRFKCGTCWDISYCAIVELKKSGYDATPYWYEVTGNETHPNHMFIIITINDQYYIFEASMLSHGGIHGPFNSLNDIFKKYIQWQIKTRDVGDSIIFHQITQYPLPGTSYDEFFQQVRKSPIISKISF